MYDARRPGLLQHEISARDRARRGPHEAKWFGDDIALTATKYEYEPKSFREAVGMLRRFGAGRSAPH
jgi:hypothetical protein